MELVTYVNVIYDPDHAFLWVGYIPMFWIPLHNVCGLQLAEIVSHIFNSTLRTGVVTNQWPTAVFTPVPKIPNPGTLSDFRPISITPILSRIIEKLVVSRWLRPAITSDFLSDQFAFRPTGSTSCALVYFIHHVTRMLETNSYVRCLFVDFSKAFDVVDYVVLNDKLSKLHLPKMCFKLANFGFHW